jgi:hypothetical protein
MKILLINNNPVVSRLTALSARKEDIEIDEIQEVTELTSYDYDIVFVDADSWNEDVKSTIFTHIETQKRVLFYAQDDNEDLDLFDKGILKPFLPSEVSAVIRSVDAITTLDNISHEIEEEKSIDLVEESKEEVGKLLETEPFELESAEVKTDLMDELTKIDDQKVEKETLLNSSDLENDLFENKSEELTINANDFASKSVDSDLFDLDLDEDKNLLDNELFTAEVKTTEKELNDELLEFDLDKDNEINLDNEEVATIEESVEDFVNKEISDVASELKPEVEIEEVKTEIETKVLDAEEIGAIKNILEEDISETLELEDLVAPSMVAAGVSAVALSSDELIASEETVDADKKKKKKSKKEKRVVSEDSNSSDTLVDTLSNLKVESLRELLAGAIVSIKIEFPKA